MSTLAPAMRGKPSTELSIPVDGDVVFLLKTDAKNVKFNLGAIKHKGSRTDGNTPR